MLSRFFFAAAYLSLSASLARPADLPTRETPVEQDSTDRLELNNQYAENIRASLPSIGRLILDGQTLQGGQKRQAAKLLADGVRILQQTIKAYTATSDNAVPPVTADGKLAAPTIRALLRIGRIERIDDLFVDGWNTDKETTNLRALRNHIAKVAPSDYNASLRSFIVEKAKEDAEKQYETCMRTAEKQTFSRDYIAKEAERVRSQDNYLTSAIPVSCLPQLMALPSMSRRESQMTYLMQQMEHATSASPWCARKDVDAVVSSDYPDMRPCIERNL